MHSPILRSAQLLKLDGVLQVTCRCACGDPECRHVHDVYLGDLMHVPARVPARNLSGTQGGTP